MSTTDNTSEPLQSAVGSSRANRDASLNALRSVEAAAAPGRKTNGSQSSYKPSTSLAAALGTQAGADADRRRGARRMCLSIQPASQLQKMDASDDHSRRAPIDRPWSSGPPQSPAKSSGRTVPRRIDGVTSGRCRSGERDGFADARGDARVADSVAWVVRSQWWQSSAWSSVDCYGKSSALRSTDARPPRADFKSDLGVRAPAPRPGTRQRQGALGAAPATRSNRTRVDRRSRPPRQIAR